MKRFVALCLFWPMIVVLIIMAGLVAVLRGASWSVAFISDLAVPLVLALAEVADAGDERND